VEGISENFEPALMHRGKSKRVRVVEVVVAAAAILLPQQQQLGHTLLDRKQHHTKKQVWEMKICFVFDDICNINKL
jgi:hypothetical protein